MNEQELESARHVIDYLWDDEKKHFEEIGAPGKHIFQYLELLRLYLDEDLNDPDNVMGRLKSLRRIIDYLWDDEQKHYEDDGAPVGHIFQHLETLNSYLNKEMNAREITFYDFTEELVELPPVGEPFTYGYEDEDE